VRGRSPPHRLAARRRQSKPIVDDLRLWLDTQLPLVSERSTLADAIRYAIIRWPALTRFLGDGRIELDTNPVERAIRPVVLGRKNHLFAGSDGGGARWAILCSLIETCKMNHVEPCPKKTGASKSSLRALLLAKTVRSKCQVRVHETVGMNVGGAISAANPALTDATSKREN
jgi:hypothetical protein